MEKSDELLEPNFDDMNEEGENSTGSDNRYTERKFTIYESMLLALFQFCQLFGVKGMATPKISCIRGTKWLLLYRTAFHVVDCSL